jgi:hypothetical protein
MGLTNLIIGALLLVAAAFAPSALLSSKRAAALALLPLVDLILLVRYVFGEDGYRGGGISRWEAYRSPGSASAPLFVISATVLAAAVILICVAAWQQRPRRVRLATLATGLACVFLVTVTVIAFALN